jgi:dTDP-4-dehydrorhamnose reductase
MKIFIIGANSKLAKHIYEKLIENHSLHVFKISRSSIDYVNDIYKLELKIKKIKPEFIINCAAISSYKGCDEDLTKAFKINALLPHQLSKLSNDINSILIHFSTDAVFSHNIKRLKNVNDELLPETKLGITKMLGEKLLSNYNNNLIIRLPILYGKYFKDSFFGKAIHSLKNNKNIVVANDIYCSPTSSDDVSQFVYNLILELKKTKTIKKKIIHLSSNVLISRYDFLYHYAKKIKKINYLKFNKLKDIKAIIKPLKYMGIKANVRKFKIDYNDLS